MNSLVHQMKQIESDQDSETPQLGISLPQNQETSIASEPDPSLSSGLSLSQTDKTIIELHLDGFSNIKIAEALKCSPANVSYFLRKPNVKAFLDEINQSEELRLKNLKTKFVDVIANGMKSDAGINTQLRAARLYKDATKDQEDNKTAEDIVAKLLNLQVNVQVNNTLPDKEGDK